MSNITQQLSMLSRRIFGEVIFPPSGRYIRAEDWVWGAEGGRRGMNGEVAKGVWHPEREMR